MHHSILTLLADRRGSTDYNNGLACIFPAPTFLPHREQLRPCTTSPCSLSERGDSDFLAIQPKGCCRQSERNGCCLVERQVRGKLWKLRKIQDSGQLTQRWTSSQVDLRSQLSRYDCILLECRFTVAEESLMKTRDRMHWPTEYAVRDKSAYTLSPTLKSVTPSPTSFTIPAESVPSTAG